MLKESDFVKVRTAVPTSAAAAMRAALGKAGAGEQGKYSFCSSTIKSLGRFLPLPGAEPSLGRVGELAEVEEEIIETICHKNKFEIVFRI